MNKETSSPEVRKEQLEEQNKLGAEIRNAFNDVKIDHPEKQTEAVTLSGLNIDELASKLFAKCELSNNELFSMAAKYDSGERYSGSSNAGTGYSEKASLLKFADAAANLPKVKHLPEVDQKAILGNHWAIRPKQAVLKKIEEYLEGEDLKNFLDDVAKKQNVKLELTEIKEESLENSEVTLLINSKLSNSELFLKANEYYDGADKHTGSSQSGTGYSVVSSLSKYAYYAANSPTIDTNLAPADQEALQKMNWANAPKQNVLGIIEKTLSAKELKMFLNDLKEDLIVKSKLSNSELFSMAAKYSSGEIYNGSSSAGTGYSEKASLSKFAYLAENPPKINPNLPKAAQVALQGNSWAEISKKVVLKKIKEYLEGEDLKNFLDDAAALAQKN